ncbi:MAG TPA: outer membrane protein assembly factor BamD [Kofleriaceae bacterium]|nr:outer membrane protein assembly factor BamD [Kofleriaceae bacterium]
MILAGLVVIPFGAACGGKSGVAAVDYSVSAQKNYERGLAKLGEKEWAAAAKYFAFIKSRFPYSKYAVLAELRLADAEFGAEQYLEAVDSYKLFVKFHPTHEMVANGYASLRIAEAYYEMLPGDYWILPPSFEKDQSSVEDAEEELRSFLQKYKDSPFRKKAEELLARVGKRLADHEWYVARFYWDKGKYMGTVLRLRRLIERHPGVGYDVEALWLLGRAYVKVGMPDRARETWTELVTKHPQSNKASEARDALASLPQGPAKGPPEKPQTP